MIDAERNIFQDSVISIITAAMYWHGLPLHWDIPNLCDEVNFPPSLSKPEQRQRFSRQESALRMIFDMAARIRNKQMKGLYLTEYPQHHNHYTTTPVEFYRYALAGSYPPYNKKVIDAHIQCAPLEIQACIIETSQKRQPPALASILFDIKKNKAPICTCDEKTRKSHQHLSSCAYLLACKKLHRNQVKDTARKVNLRLTTQTGQNPTPTQIYKDHSFQRRLKSLRDPQDTAIIIGYDKDLIIKNWIPQAVGKRAKGRPPKTQ